jgi:proteasome accessory factor B
MALYFSRKLFSDGSPLKQDLESAFKKIETALPAKHLAKLERIEEMFLPLAKMTRKTNVNREIFEPIKQALLFQNPLKLDYRLRKSNKSFPFEVHPYSLLLYQGEHYLLCYVPDKNGLRYFALDGIKKVERMKDGFEIPEGFSLEEFIKVPFGIFHGKPISVKVVFDSELSDYIKKRTWHPSQKIKELKDGRIILSFTASGKEEIKAWILSFGPKAKVLSPKLLRDEIEADLSRSLSHYI